MIDTLEKSSTLIAVSYDGETFADLKYFLAKESLCIHRISPEDFFQESFKQDTYFINLVSSCMKLRKKVSIHLDANQLSRFNYIHPSSVVCPELYNQGIVVYPNCSIYPTAKLGNDIIIHAGTGIAHNTKIGKGTYISGGVVLGGSTSIGDFCYIGIGTLLRDKIKIADEVHLSMNSVVKHDILESGVYGNPSLIKKISNHTID